MLMVEVFKIINGFLIKILIINNKKFFLFRENSHISRNFQIISNESKKTVRCGLETVQYRILLVRANLLEKYKTTSSINSFKTKIKTWKCETCICRLCQTYVQN